MTFEEAYKKLEIIADGNFCSLNYKVNSFSDKTKNVQISAYIDKLDWTDNFRTFQEVLDQIKDIKRVGYKIQDNKASIKD